MANASSINGFTIGLVGDLQGQDFVLVQAGDTATNFIKQNLTVSVNLSVGSVNISMILPIVTQLRNIYALVQVTFSTVN